MIPGLCDVPKLEAICSFETSVDSHGDYKALYSRRWDLFIVGLSNSLELIRLRNLLVICLHTGFLLGLFFDPEDHVPPKRRLISKALHGVISQKIELWLEYGM
jgi:hypothetical protein